MDDASAGTARTGRPDRAGAVLAVIAVAVAAALQLVVGWFTLTSGLLAPLWAIVGLGVVWLLAVWLLVRTARRRPFAAPLVPLGNALVWWAVMTAGEAWLGWTP